MLPTDSFCLSLQRVTTWKRISFCTKANQIIFYHCIELRVLQLFFHTRKSSFKLNMSSSHGNSFFQVCHCLRFVYEDTCGVLFSLHPSTAAPLLTLTLCLFPPPPLSLLFNNHSSCSSSPCLSPPLPPLPPSTRPICLTPVSCKLVPFIQVFFSGLGILATCLSGVVLSRPAHRWEDVTVVN